MDQHVYIIQKSIIWINQLQQVVAPKNINKFLVLQIEWVFVYPIPCSLCLLKIIIAPTFHVQL